MRILLDATAVNEGGGGICTFLLGLLSGWSRAEFDDDWRIIGMSALPRAVDDLVAGRGIVVRHGAPTAARRLATQQLVIPAFERRRSWLPDVILATTPVIALAPRRAPIVAMIHDLRSLRLPEEFGTLTRWYRGMAYRHGLLRADGLVTNSEFTRREVQSVADHRGPNPRVVHLGADHVDEWPLTPAQDIHGITFAHWSNKRPGVAIKAWAILREANPAFPGVLHVVGARPADRKRLNSLAVDMRIADLVRVHSFLPDPEYRQLFGSSSIVLLPTTMEGFGLPVGEAQRLGIPVVASPVGGVREVGGDAALYSESGTPESFAALCSVVLFDPHRRNRLIAAGRAHASRFTWRRTAELVRRELEATVARVRHDVTDRGRAMGDDR